MKIRNKILIYFSSTVIALSAISLLIIYILFSEYREEEFQQRQKEKVQHTLQLLTQYREMDESLSDVMDKLTIHDFYDEKILIFDMQKDLIYESIDDLPISNYKEILHSLSPNNRWIETKDAGYDIIGTYIESANSHFYAISKAYDLFGYSKLTFLRNSLIVIFLATVITVLTVSVFLSKKISKPIVNLVEALHAYRLDKEEAELQVATSTAEIRHLIETFNKLIKRTNETFAFQKHTVQHISHELKTPITILVSELERISQQEIQEHVRVQLLAQVNKAKSLGDIINSLLEISKIESGQSFPEAYIRLDELIFDLIDEIKMIHPSFVFEQNYYPESIDESRLKVKGNTLLLKQAFQNILINCVNYADNGVAQITIDCSSPTELKIRFANSGLTVNPEEEKFLFDYFFSGKNSLGKSGFGLGLVLTNKILHLHNGKITYTAMNENFNLFEVLLRYR